MSAEPIAIIGMSIAFPKDTNSSSAFWDVLVKGQNMSTDFPKDRINPDGFFTGQQSETALHNFPLRGGHFVNRDITHFDAPFFSITPAEAPDMDPQQRILLETAFHAFENAGIPMDRVRGSQIAVYTGCFTDDYRSNLYRSPEYQGKYAATGISSNMLANRISWFFDLKGPSLNLDTACSSSLVALHCACQEIQHGSSDMALVGGCNLIFNPDLVSALANLGMLSPDSRSYSFDARANGYGRGEGFGVLVLKKLNSALADGDNIRAIIRGTSTNQDGRTPGIFLPSVESQRQLIRQAYRRAGLDTNQTAYFEAHGTGTAAGDPIEAEAIAQAFGTQHSRPTPLYVGSVKSNIGHLEGASGIAGIVKAILMLEHGVIPPVAGLTTVNPQIAARGWNLEFPKESLPWPQAGIRRVSVSSFGFGGTNAHAILDDASGYVSNGSSIPHTTDIPRQATASNPSNGNHNVISTFDAKPVPDSRKYLLTWSSTDQTGIGRVKEVFQEYLRSASQSEKPQKFLPRLAFTLNTRRSHFPWRSFSLVSMEDLHNGELTMTKAVHRVSGFSPAFIFSGQGAQWARMGAELLQFPVFQKSLVLADKQLRSLGCTWGLLDELLKPDAESQIHDPSRSQPLCTALQIALVDLLESWGIYPNIVVGHSSGEIAAAYCVGALSQLSSLKVAYFRGLLSARLATSGSEKGGMISIGLSETDVQPYLIRVNAKLSKHSAHIGCRNSPQNVTVTGPLEAINQLQEELSAADTFCRKLATSVAYHSSLVEDIAEEYSRSLSGLVARKAGRTPSFVSSVSQSIPNPAELCQPHYWVNNLLSPVEFDGAIRTALSLTAPMQAFNETDPASGLSVGSPITAFIELGPHAVLKSPIKQIIEDYQPKQVPLYFSCLIRKSNAVNTLLTSIGHLHCLGLDVALNKINTQVTDSDTPLLPLCELPQYPFNHSKSYWSESPASRRYRLRSTARSELLGVPEPDFNPDHARWRHVIRLKEKPWVEDHKIDGFVLYPAAGMLVMAIEAVRQLIQGERPIFAVEIKDVTIEKSLPISSDGAVETQLQLRRQDGAPEQSRSWYEFTLHSLVDDTWSQHCHGLVAVYSDEKTNAVSQNPEAAFREDLLLRAFEASDRCTQTTDVQPFYEALNDTGLGYGPSFQVLSTVSCNVAGEAVSQLGLPSTVDQPARARRSSHTIHPTTLDGILQASFPALSAGGTKSIPTLVPTQIGHIWLRGEGLENNAKNDKVSIYANSHFTSSRDAQCAVTVFEPSSSKVLAYIHGLEVTAVGDSNLQPSVGAQERNLAYWIQSKVDAEVITDENLRTLAAGTIRTIDRAAFSRKLRKTIYVFVKAASDAIGVEEAATLSQTTRRYLAWARDRIDRYNQGTLPFAEPGWNSTSVGDSAFQQTCDSLAAESMTGKLYVTIGRQLVDILRGNASSLDILFRDGLVEEYYREMNEQAKATKEMMVYLDHLAHSRPGIKIIEIGAGVGSFTDLALQVLSVGKDSTSKTFRFSQYDYTDLSPSFFEKAKDRFAQSAEKMRFRVLDIEKAPADQGFEEHAYDLVIASNVLHATRNLSETLTNTRKLLRPGGKLMFFDVTAPDALGTSFVFGLLDGWWRSEEEFRSLTPNITSDHWNQLLQETGFSGLDMDLHDFEDSGSHEHSAMIATAVEPDSTETTFNGKFMVVSRDIQQQQSFGNKVTTNLANSQQVPVEQCLFDELDDIEDPENCICVFLLDIERAFLSELTETHFHVLQKFYNRIAGLVWVTMGGGATTQSPSFGLSTGFIRALRTERDNLKATALALDATKPAFNRWMTYIHTALNKMVLSEPEDCEVELIEKNGLLHVNRVVEATSMDDTIRNHVRGHSKLQLPFGQAKPVRLEIQSPGLLDSLIFRQLEEDTSLLGSDEIEIDVKASGVNFRDCLIALGRISGKVFGFECAGVVTKVGRNVTPFSVGDRVCGSAIGTFQSVVRCHKSAVMALPEKLSFVQGAALPTTMSTAYYSLAMVAKIKPKETILIHAGSGGTGQAAIQIAHILGAEVFTTVSTLEKKSLLMDVYGISEDHIFYSRDTSFAKAIHRATRGRGVDVVLNSLVGDLLRSSFDCLAPFGRFVEIGKRDILTGSSLQMSPFNRGASFHAVDLSLVLTTNTDLMTDIRENVARLLREDQIKPAEPLHVYPVSEIEKAFRYLQGGKNTGKTVIDMSSDSPITALMRVEAKAHFDPSASYVIAGGFGGLGRCISRWLVSGGARNLILISRFGPKAPEAKELLVELRAQDVTVAAPACDCSDKSKLESVFLDLGRTMPPVRGCIVASMLLKDSLFDRMSFEDWNQSLQAKYQTSWNLHEILPRGMDFFMTLSSLAGIVGSAAQVNYAAGNAYQDALVRYRLSIGEKAVSLDLGVMLDDGFLNEHKKILSVLTSFGHLLGITQKELYGILDHYCQSDLSIADPERAQLVLGIERPATLALHGTQVASWMRRPEWRHFFQMKTSSTENKDGSGKIQAIDYQRALSEAKDMESAIQIVASGLRQKVCRALAIEEEDLEESRQLQEYGVDSLVAVELRNWCRKELGADVTVFDILESSSLAGLTRSICDRSTYVQKKAKQAS